MHHYDTLPEAVAFVTQRAFNERLIILHADTYTVSPMIVDTPMQIIGAACEFFTRLFIT